MSENKISERSRGPEAAAPVKLNYRQNHEAYVKARTAADLKNHVICLVHKDGLYRHWRCAEPGTWNMGFNIVTWPGSLCYTGDMGDYLFQRTDDMVAFMRRSAMSFSYAEEKCVAHDGRVEEWREELFLEELDDLRQQYLEAAEFDGEDPPQNKLLKIEELREVVGGDYPEHQAMEALYDSGLLDGGDMPSCKYYTFHFLWCLHAIQWFCDNVKDE